MPGFEYNMNEHNNSEAWFPCVQFQCWFVVSFAEYTFIFKKSRMVAHVMQCMDQVFWVAPSFPTSDLVTLLRIMQVLPYSLMLVNLFIVYRQNIVEIGCVFVHHNCKPQAPLKQEPQRFYHLSHEKRPWWFRLYRGLYMPSYMGIIMNHCKDPY